MRIGHCLLGRICLPVCSLMAFTMRFLWFVRSGKGVARGDGRLRHGVQMRLQRQAPQL